MSYGGGGGGSAFNGSFPTRTLERGFGIHGGGNGGRYRSGVTIAGTAGAANTGGGGGGGVSDGVLNNGKNGCPEKSAENLRRGSTL